VIEESYSYQILLCSNPLLEIVSLREETISMFTDEVLFASGTNTNSNAQISCVSISNRSEQRFGQDR
jgi:hypothetical protein